MIQRLPNLPETIRPIGKRALVEIVKYEGVKTEGGIFIPDEAAKNNAKEAIIAAFDDEILKDVKIGDKVALHKYRSQAIHKDGREFRYVDAVEDILGTIPPDWNASFTVNTQ